MCVDPVKYAAHNHVKNTRRAPLCLVDRLAGELTWIPEVFSLSSHIFVRRPKPRPPKPREKKTRVITKTLIIIIHRVSASNVSRRKMRFLVSYLEYQKRSFCFILFILLYFVLLACQHNIKLIHSVMQVIKQGN